MTFEATVFAHLQHEADTSTTFVEDFTAWRASVQRVVREYCKMQKVAKDRAGSHNAVIAGLFFFGAVTLGVNVKVGGVVGGVVALIVVIAHVGDTRSFDPYRFLRSEGTLPDVLLGMLADAPDVPEWLKASLAVQLDENSKAGWSQLAWVLDEISGVLDNNKARRASGAQRLMQFIRAK